MVWRYSITSMARTRMARLPWIIRTLFFSPYKILPIAQENKYLGISFFLFYHGIVCCVYSLESPRSLESPHRGDSNEYTQHTKKVREKSRECHNHKPQPFPDPKRNHCVENRKDFPNLSIFASLTCAMINPQWIELPMSRTNFHGPKDVRAMEVRLYACVFYRILNFFILFFFFQIFHIFNLFHASILWKCICSRYLVSATPPTVLYHSHWNYTGVSTIVWRYACAFFFRILKLLFFFFFTFFHIFNF